MKLPKILLPISMFFVLSSATIHSTRNKQNERKLLHSRSAAANAASAQSPTDNTHDQKPIMNIRQLNVQKRAACRDGIVGDPCNRNCPCSSPYECVNEVCVSACPNGIFGDPCNSWDCPCRSPYECVNDVCVSDLGESCKHDSNCNVQDSECYNGACVCLSGYQPEGSTRCTDINECNTGLTYFCEQGKGVCTNHIGAPWTCTCNDGFVNPPNVSQRCIGISQNTSTCGNTNGLRTCLTVPPDLIEISETPEFLSAASKGETAKTERIEENKRLFENNVTADINSATGVHQSLLNASSNTEIFLSGLAVEAATKAFISENFNDNNNGRSKLQGSERDLVFRTTFTNTVFGRSHCYPSLACDTSEPCRSYDGSCNNPFIPLLGMAATPFMRLLPPVYQDALQLHEPRTKATDGSDLPCAREVSQILDACPKSKDLLHTMMVMQWGQFIDHDLTLSPTAKLTSYGGGSVECCESVLHDIFVSLPLDSTLFAPFPTTSIPRLSKRSPSTSSLRHRECFPICIDKEDPFYGCYKKTCMNFVRTSSAPSIWCTFGPREQVNDLSHFLDGSMIYGSSLARANSLRTFSEGKLIVQLDTDSRHMLPPQTSGAHCKPSSGYCFRAGDVRVNEQPNLALTHTIWMREHNRIAAHYTALGYDDENAFQKARKLVIAEIQHITYNEFLPVVLGPTYMAANDMVPKPLGQYYLGYNALIDPRIANAFATAAFRFGHSLIGDNIEMYWSDLVPPIQLPLSTMFSNQGLNHYWGNRMLLAFGLTQQYSEKVDMCFTTEVTQKLFEEAGMLGTGLDLVALNIQRGRDHGLPPYVKYRNDYCNSANPINTFGDMTWLSPSMMSLLTGVYSSVEDVDLFVGGLLEPLEADALVGETFQCIMGDQFFRLKAGDRFFYENNVQPSPFNIDQLDGIKSSVTLARIFCDNADAITEIQPNVFSTSMSLSMCSDTSDIPELDLDLFT